MTACRPCFFIISSLPPSSPPSSLRLLWVRSREACAAFQLWRYRVASTMEECEGLQSDSDAPALTPARQPFVFAAASPRHDMREGLGWFIRGEVEERIVLYVRARISPCPCSGVQIIASVLLRCVLAAAVLLSVPCVGAKITTFLPSPGQ